MQPPVRVFIAGVNLAGLESGNPYITSGRTIPWLQDTAQVNAWGKWNVTWRDVIVLDGQNQRILTYNLTVHDLGNPANYADLKTALINAAAIP